MVDNSKPKAQKIGMVVYFDWRKSMKSMSYEQKGKLFDYILEYGEKLYKNEHIEPPQDEYVAFAFNFMQGQQDRDYQKWLNKCEQNKKNIMKRYNKKEDDPDFNPFNP